MAMSEHSTCITWSCRYLFDWHALYSVETDIFSGTKPVYTASCRLCWYSQAFEVPDEICQKRLEQHADSHRLWACSQDVFTNEDEFRHHMETLHQAEHSDTTVWRSLRFVEKMKDKYVARTWLEPPRNLLCETEFTGYHCVLSNPL